MYLRGSRRKTTRLRDDGYWGARERFRHCESCRGRFGGEEGGERSAEEEHDPGIDEEGEGKFQGEQEGNRGEGRGENHRVNETPFILLTLPLLPSQLVAPISPSTSGVLQSVYSEVSLRGGVKSGILDLGAGDGRWLVEGCKRWKEVRLGNIERAPKRKTLRAATLTKRHVDALNERFELSSLQNFISY